MEPLTEDTLDTAAATQPLPLTVTEAGHESLVLRVLVRRAIPILRHPEGYSRFDRCQLAESLSKALEGESSSPREDPLPEYDDGDVPPEEEAEYEPGSRLEDPWQ